VPAILVLLATDFDEAKREADAAAHTPRWAHEQSVLGAGPRERLLPPQDTYGTSAPCAPCAPCAPAAMA
jgi:hypothetical protein